ncbi:DUF6790 family protein [Microbacterium sp. X-17]|uniref:DUF6790 family protein n=1 Tax=Microbacterium sp. X-17 TaxID=3144404 RepID=UPI0031F57D46
MDSFIGAVITFLVGDYFVTLVLIALVIGLIVAGVRHRWAAHDGWRTLLDWYVLWGVGISNLVNFVFHSFLGDFSAEQIGWAQSPFQLELALASLGMGIAGVVVFARRTGWWAKFAATVPPTVFMFGAGIGHIYQAVSTGNTAFANSGPILYSDLLIPIWAVVLLVLARVEERRAERLVPA